MRTVQSNYTTWTLDQGVSLHDLLVLAGAVDRGRVLAALAHTALLLLAPHRAVASFPSAARNNSMILCIAFP